MLVELDQRPGKRKPLHAATAEYSIRLRKHPLAPTHNQYHNHARCCAFSRSEEVACERNTTTVNEDRDGDGVSNGHVVLGSTLDDQG
jgi:hypothetical protein